MTAGICLSFTLMWITSYGRLALGIRGLPADRVSCLSWRIWLGFAHFFYFLIPLLVTWGLLDFLCLQLSWLHWPVSSHIQWFDAWILSYNLKLNLPSITVFQTVCKFSTDWRNLPSLKFCFTCFLNYIFLIFWIFTEVAHHSLMLSFTFFQPDIQIVSQFLSVTLQSRSSFT